MFTYLQILNIIKETALDQPNVHSVVREFLDLNREDAQYSAVVIQDRDGQRDRIYEQDWVTYTWHLGYVDRLCYDESNRDDIYSTGINVLNNIVNSIRNRFYPELEVSVIDRFTTFNQRFTAQCAGVYIVLAVNVAVSDCEDEVGDMYQEFHRTITENGEYHFVPDGKTWDSIDLIIDVHPEVDSEALYDEIVSNGVYVYTPPADKYYDGVEIDVDVHPTQRLNRTYTTNGQKTLTGEWKDGTININVPVPYVHSTSLIPVTQNGVQGWYAPEGEAYDEIQIDVDVHPSDSLDERFTENGTYNLTGEWKDGQVVVDVPEGGLPKETVTRTIAANGHYDILPQEGYTIGSVSLDVDVPSVSPTMAYGGYLSQNGNYQFLPDPGYSFYEVNLEIDVHPGDSLEETFTSNGTYNLTGEWKDGVIVVDVPERKTEVTCERTIRSSGIYTYYPQDGEVFNEVIINVDIDVPTPNSNEIYYTTYTSDVISLYDDSDFGVNLLSNTRRGSYCVLSFDGPVLRTGVNSFYGRTGLRTVYLPASVTVVSQNSFSDSGLQMIVMPDTIQNLSGIAFSGCYALTSPFRIPTGCRNIGVGIGGTFRDCTALTTITIPSRVTDMGPGAFADCSHLFNVIMHPVVPPVLHKDINDEYSQFYGCSSRLVIRVPGESLQAYKTAPGWSEYADRIIEYVEA